MDVFSKRLRIAMKNKNITTKELTEKSGLYIKTIYAYLNPDKYNRGANPHVANFEAVADVLDVSMDWLWGHQMSCYGCKYASMEDVYYPCNRCLRKANDFYCVEDES